MSKAKGAQKLADKCEEDYEKWKRHVQKLQRMATDLKLEIPSLESGDDAGTTAAPHGRDGKTWKRA